MKKNGKKEKEKKLPNVSSRSSGENILCMRTTCQIDMWYHLYFHLQHKNLLYKHLLKMSQLEISLTLLLKAWPILLGLHIYGVIREKSRSWLICGSVWWFIVPRWSSIVVVDSVADIVYKHLEPNL